MTVVVVVCAFLSELAWLAFPASSGQEGDQDKGKTVDKTGDRKRTGPGQEGNTMGRSRLCDKKEEARQAQK